MTRALLRGLMLVLALPLAGSAQRVRVDARISPTSGQVGDVMILDITVVTSGQAPDAIQPPSLPAGLRLIGSNEFTEYQFRLPGGRTRTTRRELTLNAVSPGHYVIPPMIVRVDGAPYRTRPLRLDVSAAYAGGGAAAASPASGPGDEVLLQAWATPDTAWVGEQVTVRADALFSSDVRSRLAGAPQYEGLGAPGFWVYDLVGSDGGQYRPVRGRTYEVQTFRRAFFPLAAGRFFIPGSHLSYAVRRGFLSGPESYELRSDSIPVLVRPLPADGRPGGFAGAVGRFTASARIEPGSVGVGEAATLTLEVRGDGNIKAVPPPRLPTIAGVQVFAPVEDADIRVDDEQVGGVKRFSWVLIPSRPGSIAIAPLELDYFDPAQGRYGISRTEALGLSVGAAGTAARRGGGAGPIAIGALLRPLHEQDEGLGVSGWVESRVFRALASLPAVLLLGLGVDGLVRRRRRARPAARARATGMLDRLREKAAELRRTATSAGTSTGTGTGTSTTEAQLLEFMGGWLAERLGEPALVGMGVGRLDAALREAGVRPVVAAALAGLAGQLEEARYRPEPPSPAQRVAWVDEAERLLAEVHAGAGRRRRGAGGRGALALALAGAVTLAPGRPARAEAAPDAPTGTGAAAGVVARDTGFAPGVAAFRAGRYAQAADLFSDYAAAHPAHAAAWYDLGNAAFRAGQHGRAVWAWLRALKLRPRDADARQNLALAGVDPGIVDAVTPPVALSLDEMLLLAGVAWLLAAALLLVRRLAPRRGLATASVLALLIAGALVGTAGFTARAPARAIVLDGTTLLGAPNEHADVLGQLTEGAAVELVERQRGWARVRATIPAAPGTAPAAGPAVATVQEGWIEEGRLGAL